MLFFNLLVPASAWAAKAILAPLRLLLVEAESVQLEAETSPVHRTGNCQQPSEAITGNVEKQGDWLVRVKLCLPGHSSLIQGPGEVTFTQICWAQVQAFPAVL